MANRYLDGERPAPRRRTRRRCGEPGRRRWSGTASGSRAACSTTRWRSCGSSSAAANKTVDAEQPWVLAKAAKAGDDEARERLRGVLGDLVEACRLVGLAVAPFMPAIAPRVLAQLGYAYAYGGRRQRRPAASSMSSPGAPTRASRAGVRRPGAALPAPRRRDAPADPARTARCAAAVADDLSGAAGRLPRPRQRRPVRGGRRRVVAAPRGGRRGAAPRPGLERRLVGAARWSSSGGSLARCGGRRPSARRGQGRRRPAGRGSSTSPAIRRVVAIGETGLDYDRGLQPARRTSWRTCAATWPRRRARQAGHPPLPLGGRARATPRTLLVAELARPASAADAGRRGVRGPPPASSIPSPARSTTPRRCSSSGSPSASRGLVFRARRGGHRRRWPDRPADRLLVETDSPFLPPPGAPRRRNAPEWVRVTARGWPSAAATDAEALGDDLVGDVRPHLPPAENP